MSTGQFVNLFDNPTCAWLPCTFGVSEALDVTTAPNGDLLVGAARSQGPEIDPFHYVLRLGAGGNRALARASVTYFQTDPARRARGVAADAAGNLFASFPEGVVQADHDRLFRFAAGFPAGGAADAEPWSGSLIPSEGLLVDPLQRLFLTLPDDDLFPARIEILSTQERQTLLQVLRRRLLDDPQMSPSMGTKPLRDLHRGAAPEQCALQIGPSDSVWRDLRRPAAGAGLRRGRGVRRGRAAGPWHGPAPGRHRWGTGLRTAWSWASPDSTPIRPPPQIP